MSSVITFHTSAGPHRPRLGLQTSTVSPSVIPFRPAITEQAGLARRPAANHNELSNHAVQRYSSSTEIEFPGSLESFVPSRRPSNEPLVPLRMSPLCLGPSQNDIPPLRRQRRRSIFNVNELVRKVTRPRPRRYSDTIPLMLEARDAVQQSRSSSNSNSITTTTTTNTVATPHRMLSTVIKSNDKSDEYHLKDDTNNGNTNLKFIIGEHDRHHASLARQSRQPRFRYTLRRVSKVFPSSLPAILSLSRPSTAVQPGQPDTSSQRKSSLHSVFDMFRRRSSQFEREAVADGHARRESAFEHNPVSNSRTVTPCSPARESMSTTPILAACVSRQWLNVVDKTDDEDESDQDTMSGLRDRRGRDNNVAPIANNTLSHRDKNEQHGRENGSGKAARWWQGQRQQWLLRKQRREAERLLRREEGLIDGGSIRGSERLSMWDAGGDAWFVAAMYM